MSANKLIVSALAITALLGIAMAGRILLTRDNETARPQTASAFATAMQTYFPEDWQEYQHETSQPDADKAQIHAALMSDLKPLVARAPDTALIALIKAEAALVRQLQSEDLAACAHLTLYGAETTHTYSPAAQRLADRAAALTVKAARQGLDTPSNRQLDPQAAAARMTFAMRDQGVPSRIVDHDPSIPLSPKDQCEAASYFYDTLSAMPPAEAADTFVNLNFV